MADITKLNGYDIKDKKARADIVNIADDIADIQEELTEQSERIDDVAIEVNALSGEVATVKSAVIEAKNRADEAYTRADECFISVSNGKIKVASAITDKGVPTAPDATFQTMADNIRQIPSGGIPDIDWSKLVWKPGVVVSTNLMTGLAIPIRTKPLGSNIQFKGTLSEITEDDSFEINIKVKHLATYGWQNTEAILFGSNYDYSNGLPRIKYNVVDGRVIIHCIVVNNRAQIADIDLDFGDYWHTSGDTGYQDAVYFRVKYDGDLKKTTFYYSFDGSSYTEVGSHNAGVTVTATDEMIWGCGNSASKYPALDCLLEKTNWKINDEIIWGLDIN